MLHKEIDIPDNNYQIKASLKTPDNTNSKTGIILAHGGIVSRHSLSRPTISFSEYLCKELDAYVITPDFLGETIHKKTSTFSDYSKIINNTTDYLAEEYDLDMIMGFGHSMGCYVLAKSLQSNNRLTSIVNYGGPIKELEKQGKNSFIKSLVNQLSSLKLGINVKNIAKYVFDEETSNYLFNVMMKDNKFGYMYYNFDFEFHVLMDILHMMDEYIKLIKESGKPVLLLFGTDDTLLDTTRSFYHDGYVDENIMVKHVPGGTHITPCMESPQQYSKLEPAINFYRNQIDNKVFNGIDLRTQELNTPYKH